MRLKTKKKKKLVQCTRGEKENDQTFLQYRA